LPLPLGWNAPASEWWTDFSPAASPLPQIIDEVDALAAKVDGHLKKMGCQP
jgi:hypothetical protein